MTRVNIAGEEFHYDPSDPDGFRSGMLRLGPLLGASELGASVYELPAGQSLCPYHYEHAEEEYLLVLSGTPSVRTPAGIEELRPWDVVYFQTGPDGAHEVRNASGETARVLMFSTVRYPNATVYPDSDKVAVWTREGKDNLIVHRASGVDYWSGEERPEPTRR